MTPHRLLICSVGFGPVCAGAVIAAFAAGVAQNTDSV
jgi:hypothetical protein